MSGGAGVPEATIQVLLIEDNPGDAALVREALADARAADPAAPALSLVTADRLASGLALLRDEGVQVVLLDLGLPDSQGLDTFLRVQSAATTRPVVVLSRLDDETVATRAIREGAQDYLGKGDLDGERLLRAVRHALVRKRGEMDRAQLAVERAARAEADAQRARLERLFTQAPALVNVQRGPDHVFELVHPLTYQLLRRRPLLGLPVREAIPELTGQGLFERLDEVYATGEPFFGRELLTRLDRRNDGTLDDVYWNFVYEPMRDAEGRVEGVMTFAFDVTEQVLARQRAEALAERLRRREELFRVAQEVSPIGFSYHRIVRDAAGEVADLEYVYQNEAAARINRLPSGDAPDGGSMLAAFPQLRDSEIWGHYRRVAATGEAWQGEAHYGGEHFDAWFCITAVRPTEETLGLTFEDVTSRKRIFESATFLARASAVLGSSLDVGATLQQLAALAVPERADWCSVHLLDDGGEITLAASSHVDPARDAVLRELNRRYPHALGDGSGPGAVMRAGRTLVLTGLTDAHRQGYARDAAHLEMMRELPVTSVVTAPMVLQGRTLGSISLAVAAEGRRFEPSDAAWVEELARRVAIAVDNARLFEMAQHERARAEEANLAKDLFLSTLSHELRTPLNAILGWARMLKTGSLPDDKRDRALDTIDRNARAQVALIEDILDISRITSGKLRLAVAPVEIIQVVEAALDTMRPAADARGVRLQAVLDPDAGTLHGDATRLQQVVWNLVSNAVKFTPKGGRVYVRLQREESHVEILVGDTGQGIDAEFLPHVFEAFRQQDATSTRRHGGLGLGLAIVKHLVELHGGTIRAESDGAGRGASFTVRFPIAPVRASPAPPVSAAVMVRPGVALDCPSELEGLRILTCDDEEDARDLVRSVLEHCKAAVTTVASAAEALEALRGGSFDVLVSDVGMPGEDGYGLIRKVRALPAAQGGRIPAVALTAYASTSDRTRALMAGFHAHAVKPIEPHELIVVIANLVGRFSAP